MAYVSGILFIQEDSPNEIGTAVGKFVCNSRPSRVGIVATWIANPAR